MSDHVPVRVSSGTRRHLESLISQGWSLRDIAAVSALSSRTVALIRSGKATEALPGTIAALESVSGSPPPGPPHRNLTIPDEVTRRLADLVAAGWTARRIGEAVGVTTETVSQYIRGLRTSIQQRTVDAILLLPVRPPVLGDRDRVTVPDAFHVHVGELVAAGWQLKQIAAAAGATYSVFLKVHTRKLLTIEQGMLLSVLAVSGAPPVRPYAGLEMATASVMDHLRDLTGRGWTHEEIASAAGVKVNVVSRLLRGEGRQYRAGTGAALLAVAGDPPIRVNPNDLVDAKPVRAHVRALLREPSTLSEIARVAQVSHHSVARVMCAGTRRVQRSVADRILAVESAGTGKALVSGEQVQAHVRELRAAGVSFADMERVSGVEQSTLRALVRDERMRVTADVRDWLLQLSLTHPGLVTNAERVERKLIARDAARAYLACGYTAKHLAELTGIRRGTVSAFVNGTRGKIAHRLLERLERVVLGVSPPPGPESLVSPIASIRRVQALIALGWSIDSLVEMSGMRFLRRIATRWPVSQPMRLVDAEAVAALANRIGSRRGRSRKTAVWGARMGWLVPAWWDEATIGVLDAYPEHRLLPREITAARRKQVAALAERGYTSGQISDALVLPVATVSRDRHAVARLAAA